MDTMKNKLNKEFIKNLSKRSNNFEDRYGVIIANKRITIRDVLDVRQDLTIEQCKYVLFLLKRKYDTSDLVTLEVIYNAAELLYPS